MEPDGNVYLVTDYYPNGSLGEEMRRLKSSGGKCLPSWNARFFFLDMLKALHYCHKVIGVVHRDIKPENIMIGQNREAVLIDFGVSAMYDLSVDAQDPNSSYLKLKAGTYLFFAPELFDTKTKCKFGPKTDVWALGLTFYYLLTG